MKKYGNFRWRVFGAIILVNSSILSFPQNDQLSGHFLYDSPELYTDFGSQAGSFLPLRPSVGTYVAELANRPTEQTQVILSPQPVRRSSSPSVSRSPSVSPVPWSGYIASPIARTCSGFGYKKNWSLGDRAAIVRRVSSMPSFHH